MTQQIQIDQARLMSELATLATFTNAEPVSEGTSVTRVVFSPDDLRARAWLKQLAIAEGFEVRDDAVGNLFIRWSGTEPNLPAVATGSHTDAIPHAGMYDGTVGVLGGLEAMRALKRTGLRPRRSIELVMFTSEEPTRFGIGCLGSRLISGTLDPKQADALSEANEPADTAHTLAQVRTAAGFTGDLASVKLAPNHYHAWLELHIEQGPLLERDGIPLGIVTSIAAPAGYRFTVSGLGGHAGALLMPDRKDALCAAAELILSIERHTLATRAIDTVATVGTCDVHPGAVNSVPSRVVLQLDIRDTDPTRRESVMQAVRRDIEELRQRRSVIITEQLINADAPAQSSPHIVELLEEVCAAHGISPKKMVSRAYHDSLFISRIAPIAMIFIPCRNGVSHRPDEYATPADTTLGVEVLASVLAKLASE
ncbi:M20 family metallo-hydrolase [Tunturibacter empetritectus]|uniref:N-carbamoyl-L-amino-acid hydrolase n=1 Tax=Tunturiibacter empetritectus TaxID=3069691 RepID=A0A7W8IL10_9BACT|nr:M20 family metallo-hydrolase [Edaphobacter lichenicola]MBB5319134.1 N-carbamoyl-L-amino-acid hydrolase [Edaphobacter lichenicola]